MPQEMGFPAEVFLKNIIQFLKWIVGGIMVQYGNNQPQGFNPTNYVTNMRWFAGNHAQSGFEVNQLFHVVNNATISAKVKIGLLSARRSAISIGDMFEMQMLMNHLSQLSEMSSNVVSAANSAIMTMARNVKG